MQGNSKLSKYFVNSHFSEEDRKWMQDILEKIGKEESSSSLFLNYSQLSNRFRHQKPLEINPDKGELEKFASERQITPLELARIYLLSEVILIDSEKFIPKVRKIIQIADKEELRTFLTYLSVLPQPEAFKDVGVEALRTNITPVFDAIALNNPYPAAHFDENQWNQMFLKAAFMQRPLHKINSIEKRANAALARIISDYAHERWAAGRDVDPYIWRPVGAFITDEIRSDIVRLLKSQSVKEQIAGVLCVQKSEMDDAAELLQASPELVEKYNNKELSWAQVI